MFLAISFDEMRLYTILQHPNIVRLLDLGHAGQFYYKVNEYVEGIELFQVLQMLEERDAFLHPSAVAELGIQMCKGLEYAYQLCTPEGQPLQTIHRRLSPYSLSLSKEGTLKIADFEGAAGFLRKPSENIFFGKFGYMSPEQTKGKVLDRQTDLYSAGAVLYQLATRRLPFEEESDIETLRAIMDKEPMRIQQHRPDFPSELGDVIFRALQKEPQDRFSSALDFQLALERFSKSLKNSHHKGQIDFDTLVQQVRSSNAEQERRWIEKGEESVDKNLFAGKYRRLRRLAYGGLGETFLALDMSPSGEEKKVVLRIVHEDAAETA